MADYHAILSGVDKNIYHNPLGIGFDIETGGHVMNATLLTADRNTHIKIVAMGLSAALMIALASLVAH